MKVLVTGANGLLGVNLIRELIRAGDEALAFVRPSANLKGLQDVPCKIFRGDILSYEDISKALHECDAVVHAASTTSVLPVGFAYYKKINVDATENVVRSVLNQGNKRLIYVGTGNAFAPGSKEHPGNESKPFNLFHYGSGYINSKYMAQQYVLENVERYNLNAVVVNPTFIIGPYDIKPSSGQIILHGLKSLQWCPPGGRNFVHVNYVTRGIRQALLHGKEGHCYLLAGENLSYKEFFALMSQVTHKKSLCIPVSKILIQTAAVIAEAWSRFSAQPFAFNKTNATLFCLDNYYTGDKAKAEFNLTAIPVKNAIEQALDWFRNENYISEDDYSVHGTNLDL